MDTDAIKKALDDLRYCSEIFETQRFDGLDQNPKDVRDILYSAISTIRRELPDVLASLEKEAAK